MCEVMLVLLATPAVWLCACVVIACRLALALIDLGLYHIDCCVFIAAALALTLLTRRDCHHRSTIIIYHWYNRCSLPAQAASQGLHQSPKASGTAERKRKTQIATEHWEM